MGITLALSKGVNLITQKLMLMLYSAGLCMNFASLQQAMLQTLQVSGERGIMQRSWIQSSPVDIAKEARTADVH
jgi:hypothetical protein